MEKFISKIIFECLNNQKDSLRNYLETHRFGKHYEIIFIEDYRFNELYVEVVEDENDESVLVALNDLANLYGVKMYFLSTDKNKHFYSNDIDGIFFDELYYVSCHLPSGKIIEENFSSTYEIIEMIETIMGEEYASYDESIKSICEYCEKNSCQGEYFFKIHDYKMVEVFENSLQSINC